MLKVKFFHTPKNKKFNYIPRYYNPEEEEKEERRRKLSGETRPGDSIRGQFTERRKKTKKASRVSNTRAIIIIVILLFLAYWLFYGSFPFM